MSGSSAASSVSSISRPSFRFYLATGLDLRAVRAFRLLRLLRTLKLVRYSRAVQRFHRAFVIARDELILFAGVTLILLYLSAVGIYHFEPAAQPERFASVFHASWWPWPR